MKPFLALFRAGPNSLHSHAVARLEEQNFDYALSWFGDQAPQHAKGAAFVHMQKGGKWTGLQATLQEYWPVISRYRYVWLPDDDLLCDPESVSRMFLVCDDLQLELAQPALTPDSYFSHVVTLQHSAFQVRFTNFVEIMAPILSADLLQRVLPTLNGAISGWGLDHQWPRMSQLGKVAIIDDTPVKHTRPVGGPNYAFSQAAGLSPNHEMWLRGVSHFIDTPSDYHINFGGLLQNGDAIALGNTPQELEAMLAALLESSQSLKLTALQLTRYLRHHFNYVACGDAGAPTYPRALIPVVLTNVLKHAGLNFRRKRVPDATVRYA